MYRNVFCPFFLFTDMANPIDLIITQAALKVVDDAIAKVNLLDKTMQEATQHFIDNSKKMSSATPSGVNGSAENNAAVTTQLKSQANTIAELSKELGILNDKLTKLNSTKATGKKLTADEIVQNQAERRAAIELAKANSDLIGSYDKLNIKHQQAVRNAQNLGATYGETSKKFIDATAKANKLDAQLKTIDSTLGKNQRNVGNYASGYNALGNSINQLTREAPAFANSIQTGFMAISNNTAALEDAIRGIREQNKALAAEGKPTTSVLKQLGSAFFSWTSLISVGVTLLTVYGAKLIEYAFNTDAAKKATDSLTNSMKLNQSQVEKNIATLEYENKIAVEFAKKRGASEKELHDLQVKLGVDIVSANEKNYNDITKRLDSFDNYRLLKNQGGNKAFMFLLNKFNGDVSKARDEFNRREVAYTDTNRKILVDAQAKTYEAIKKQNNENVLLDLQNKNEESEALKALNKQRNDDAKKAEDDRLTAIAEARKKELELQLANIDIVLNNEDLYYTERLDALDKDFLKRVEIAKVDYDEENRLAKGNQDKQKTALINFQLEKLKLIEGYNKQRVELESLELNAITTFDNSKGKPDTDPFKSVGESAGKAVGKLKGFADASEDVRKKIAELNKETQNWLGSFSAEFLQNSGFGSLQTFFDGTFDKLLDGAETTQEKFAVYFNAIAESAQEAFNFISGISQQNFDAERERLQSQYEVSLAYAGDNKAAQEKLAQDLEKQKQQIANREAKAKQKQAIFNIAIDTAQAVVAAIAKSPLTLGMPWAAIIAGIGALQIGLVASQKIPQYWMGGTHEGGLMMVNDGKGSNFQETIVTPDGKIMQPKGRNVIMDAPKGTEIYTQDQWNNTLQEMLQGKGISMSNNVVNSGGGATANQIDSIIGKHFSKIALNNVAFDENGMRVWSERNGNKTISTANRVSRRGVNV